MDSPQSRRTVSPAKRRAILKGAQKVFLQKGFGASRMDDVAEAAGVSKMTVYRHFNSKEALFVGVLEELCSKLFRGDLEASLEILPPEQALRRFARRFVAVVMAPETIALHRLAISETNRFPKIGKLFYENGAAVAIEALSRYFARYAGDPALRVVDPRKSAEEFLELVRGYSHSRVLLGVEAPPSKKAVEKTINRALETILRK